MMKPQNLPGKMTSGAGLCRHLAELGATVDLEEGRLALAEEYARALVGSLAETASPGELRAHCRSLERLIRGHLDRARASAVPLCTLLESYVTSSGVRVDAARELLNLWRRLLKNESPEARVYDALTALRLPYGRDVYTVEDFRGAAVAILQGAPEAREKVLHYLETTLDAAVSDPQLFAAWVEAFCQIQGELPRVGSVAPWSQEKVVESPVPQRRLPVTRRVTVRRIPGSSVLRFRRMAIGLCCALTLLAIGLFLLHATGPRDGPGSSDGADGIDSRPTAGPTSAPALSPSMQPTSRLTQPDVAGGTDSNKPEGTVPMPPAKPPAQPGDGSGQPPVARAPEPIKPVVMIPTPPVKPAVPPAGGSSKPVVENRAEPNKPVVTIPVPPVRPSAPPGGAPSKPSGVDATEPNKPAQTVPVAPVKPSALPDGPPSKPSGTDATEPNKPAQTTPVLPVKPLGPSDGGSGKPPGESDTKPQPPFVPSESKLSPVQYRGRAEAARDALQRALSECDMARLGRLDSATANGVRPAMDQGRRSIDLAQKDSGRGRQDEAVREWREAANQYERALAALKHAPESLQQRVNALLGNNDCAEALKLITGKLVPAYECLGDLCSWRDLDAYLQDCARRCPDLLKVGRPQLNDLQRRVNDRIKEESQWRQAWNAVESCRQENAQERAKAQIGILDQYLAGNSGSPYTRIADLRKSKLEQDLSKWKNDKNR